MSGSGKLVKMVTSSSFAVKWGPSSLLTAIMTATMSLPFIMGAARMFLVLYSVKVSTNSLKWGLWRRMIVADITHLQNKSRRTYTFGCL